MSHGEWETPLGSVRIDSDLANFLKQKFSFLAEDIDAHRAEHAVEVQLPFLKFANPISHLCRLHWGLVKSKSGSTGLGNR